MQDAIAIVPFTPVRAVRLSEEIIRQIVHLIDNGLLQLNDRFPSERELQERWQVSRPVLREAFRVLEMQGIVESRPGAGRYLRSDQIPEPFRQRRARLQASPALLLQVWHAREAIEGKAAALAAATATPQQISVIEQALKRLKDDPEHRGYNFNHDFHMAVAKASNNVFVEEMVATILSRSNAIGFKEALQKDDWAELEGRHEMIYETIRARDPVQALAAVAKHFEAMRRSIGEQ